MNKKNYRYPGAMPFEDTEHDRLIFKGREKEVRTLLNMVLSERLTVVYGKSGMGKTSLINAGLLHLLREQSYMPVAVRFNNLNITPLQAVYSSIENYVNKNDILYEAGQKETLWQYFKTAGFLLQDKLLTPILILDQFEELFTLHSLENQSDFITQLSHVIRGIVPSHLKKIQDLPYSYGAPDVKIVISIREDFLGYLEKMSCEIPAILSNRFRLTPLSREQARMAIEEPVKIVGNGFITKPFSYEPAAIEEVLDFLSQKNKQLDVLSQDEVEAFQLQHICQYIEERVKEKQNSGETDVTVIKDMLGGKSGMQKAFQDFYLNIIFNLKLGHRKARDIINLCENGLISHSGRRLSLEEGEIEECYNVSKDILDKLVDKRLLRAEPRLGSTYYELSHDTLVDSVQDTEDERSKDKKDSIFIGIILSSVSTLLVYILFSVLGFNKLGFYNILAVILFMMVIFTSIVANYVGRGTLLALFYYSTGQYNKTIKVCRNAIKNDPKNSELYYWLGKTYYRQGKYKRSAEMLTKSSDIDPSLYDYLFLARSNVQLANHDKSKEAYKKVMELDLLSNKKYIPDLDEINLKDKNFYEALDIYEDRIKKCPQNEKSVNYLFEAYYACGKLNEARELCEKTLEFAAKNFDVLNFVADMYAALSMYDKAVEMYIKAIKAGSKQVSTYIGLGTMYYRKKDFDKAIKTFKKACKINPQDATISLYLKASYYKKGQYDEIFKEIKKEVESSLKLLSSKKRKTIDAEKEKYIKRIEVIEKAQILDPNDIDTYMDLGAFYEKLGMYSDAEKTYEKAVEVNKENADVYIRLGNLLLEKEKYKEARIVFDKLLKFDASNAGAYNGLGYLYIKEGKNEEAKAMYRKAIELSPGYSTAYVNLGILLKNEGKNEEAKAMYEKAIQLDSGDAYAYKYLGAVLEKEEKYEEAKAMYNKTVELEPDNPNGYIYLGNLLIKEEKYEEAKAMYKKAIDLDTDDTNAYIGLGLLLKNEEKDEEAEALYRKAIELEPSEPDAYIYLGNSLAQKEKFDEAKAMYKKVIELDTDNVTAYIYLGNLLIKEEKYDEAKDMYKKAIELDTDDINAYIGLGLLLKNEGKNEEAEALYRKAIELEPNEPDAYIYLGDSLAQKEKFDEAKAMYWKAIELNTDDTDVYIYIAQTLDEEKKYDEAKEMYIKAIELNPDNQYAYGNLGWIYYEMKDYPKAIETSEKSLSIDENLVYARSNLAIALLHNGDYDRAKREYEKVYEVLVSGNCKAELEKDSKKDLLKNHALDDLNEAKKVAKGKLLEQIDEMITMIEKYYEML